MVVIAIWDSWSGDPPVFSAGYNQKNAFDRHPLRLDVVEDERSRYQVAAFASSPLDIEW